MRTFPKPTGLLNVARVGIMAGLIPIAVFLIDRWSITRIEGEHANTRDLVVAQADAILERVEESEDLAALDRLCLIEALLAVRDALQGDDVPPGLPPSCAAIVAGATPPTTAVP